MKTALGDEDAANAAHWPEKEHTAFAGNPS